MRTKLLLICALCLLASVARTAELQVDPDAPIHVTLPAGWSKNDEPHGPPVVRFHTIRFFAGGNRNAEVLISVLDKDRSDRVDEKRLKEVLKADCLPYVTSARELNGIKPKSLPLAASGTAYYANFTDSNLIGKPTRKEVFKTATVMIIALGTKYVLKATILCDEFDGVDYREAMAIVTSLSEKR